MVNVAHDMQYKLREIGLLTDQEHHNYEAVQDSLLNQIPYSQLLSGDQNELTIIHINKLNALTVKGLETHDGRLRQSATGCRLDMGTLFQILLEDKSIYHKQ